MTVEVRSMRAFEFSYGVHVLIDSEAGLVVVIDPVRNASWEDWVGHDAAQDFERS
jgi:hypothetical protein